MRSYEIILNNNLSTINLYHKTLAEKWDHYYASTLRELVLHYKLLLQGTDSIESHYPNISRPYVRSGADQCNYRRYSTEGWPGGTPILELDGNHIEGAARSKVSRSSSPAAEESLGLSRFNSATSTTRHISTTYTLLILVLALLNR